MGPDKDGQNQKELLRRESGPRGRSLQHMVTAPRAHFGPVSLFCGNVRPLCSCRGSRVGLGVVFPTEAEMAIDP